MPALNPTQRQTRITYLHADHLYTPRAATDDRQTIVWRWQSDAFGETSADADPDNDGHPTHIQLRFPGQYADEESGLHYNVFRYYDPKNGRYTQSDPIGLNGGLNSFAYAEEDPLSLIDPFGLWVDGIYNKSTGILTLVDREKGTSISVLFESGGKPFGDPIPNGQYDILARAGRSGFFRLEPIDSNYGDDTEESSGRTHFRLHHPGRTLGCVAAKDEINWNQIENFINSTSSDQVTIPSMSRNPFAKKTETIERHGKITVVN